MLTLLISIPVSVTPRGSDLFGVTRSTSLAHSTMIFVTLLSLSVLVISTTPGAFCTFHLNGIQTIRSMAVAIERAIDKKADSKLSSDRDVQDILRFRRSGDYSPYTSNPYDAGPIDMCSYPELDVCNFPAGYTVPEYSARAASSYNDVLNTLNKAIRKVDSSACAKSFLGLLCDHSMPRCISNTTVRFKGNFMEVR